MDSFIPLHIYGVVPTKDDDSVFKNKVPYTNFDELIKLLKFIIKQEVNFDFDLNDSTALQKLINKGPIRTGISAAFYIIYNPKILQPFSFNEHLDMYLYQNFFQNIAADKTPAYIMDTMNICIDDLYDCKADWTFVLEKLVKQHMTLLLMLKYGWRFKKTHMIFQDIFSSAMCSIIYTLFQNNADINLIKNLDKIYNSLLHQMHNSLYHCLIDAQSTRKPRINS